MVRNDLDQGHTETMSDGFREKQRRQKTRTYDVRGQVIVISLPITRELSTTRKRVTTTTPTPTVVT